MPPWQLDQRLSNHGWYPMRTCGAVELVDLRATKKQRRRRRRVVQWAVLAAIMVGGSLLLNLLGQS
jgi:hypothetical protein